MNSSILTILFCVLLLNVNCQQDSPLVIGQFDVNKDLLLGHFDCKTDVDDLHTVAAFYTLMSQEPYSKINFHAVAGAYGTQEGLYVPPNDLFQLAFGEHWSDAHADFDGTVLNVQKLAMKILENGGDIWIADAGQSDFSAALVKKILEEDKEINSKERIHIVQHSNWNEEVTSQDLLAYVKEVTDYQKIPDGNAEGNGTPGFRDPDAKGWRTKLGKGKALEVWELAVSLGNQYNGKEGRYLNEAIAAGGLDFSDLSETCWILGLEKLKNVDAYFDMIGQ